MRSFFDYDRYSYRLNRVYFSRSKLGGFSCAGRESCELVYKLDGSSDQIFPDRTVRLLPDCIYIIPSCCARNRVVVDAAGSVINVVFDLVGCPFCDELRPEAVQLDADNPYKPLFRRLLSLWEKKDAGYVYMAQSVFSSILARIAVERSSASRSSGAYRHIKPALDYIGARFAEEIAMADMALLCGISEEYMRRLFRRFTGKNPLAYLRGKRLEAANELLYKTDLPISEIAAECGFDDPRYFTRLYGREFGISPTRARKQTAG